jgi:ankyrin repeat protein
VAALLVEKGANIDARDLNGRTPLHYAIEEGRVSVAKVLLRYGANLAITDREGLTLRDLAKKVGIEVPIA